MTTITLEVPDELAVRLDFLREQVPTFLEQTLNSLLREKYGSNGNSRPMSFDSPIYSEVLEFLASGPTTRQIAEYKVSPSLQDRVEDLLDKNREEGLTEQERAEMDTYVRVSHIMTLLKIHARKALGNSAN